MVAYHELAPLPLRGVVMTDSDRRGGVLAESGSGNQITLQPGREETPIVEVLEMRPAAEAVPTSALVDGPSHESSLPGRPPDHWLRPSRKSVVNALLPWRDRATADSFRPGPRTRRAAPIVDRRGLSEREQRLLETDLWLRVSSQDDRCSGANSPCASGRIRRARRIDGRAGASGRSRCAPPRPSRTAIRTGPPIADRPGSSRPVPGGARIAPRADAAPIASAASPGQSARGGAGDRRGSARTAIPLRLVSHHETT